MARRGTENTHAGWIGFIDFQPYRVLMHLKYSLTDPETDNGILTDKVTVERELRRVYNTG